LRNRARVYIHMAPKLIVRAAALAVALATTAAPAHAVDDPATTLAGKAGEALSAECRSNDQPEETCNQIPVGNHASAAAVAAYADSWTHRALTLQYALANDVPFADAPWVGTHNSFNSMAYGYTPSRSDSNQQLSLTDQLAIDVRSVELDVHWWNGQPTVCHGADFNAGCSTEGPVGPYLDELATFLNEHSDQVVLLYLEDHIGNAEGYDTVTSELDRAFGTKLYKSSGGDCSQPLPLDVTRDDLLSAGKQVVIVATGCGGGSAWSEMVFDWSGDVHSESRPRGYGDFPDPGCETDFDRATYESQIVRYFEDSTFVTSVGSTGELVTTPDDGITPETAAAMMRCGVDLTGLDQLLPDDGRLDALVWSWEQDEPNATGDCATQDRETARWEATSCRAQARRAACLKPDGTWLTTNKAVAYKKAAAACEKQGASFAVPRTGYENQLLRAATPDTAATTWLGYRLTGDRWQATPAL
jgi:hypothetical protein